MPPIETGPPETQEQKEKAVEAMMTGIEKAHGKGSITNLNSRVGIQMPHIPTGLYGVDYGVVGIGGLPRARLIEMYGPESSGKTTVALLAVAQAQAAGGLAAFVDVEHALDPTWMNKLEVDVDKLLVSQPDSGEEALDIVDRMLDSKAFDIIVVDSVAALIPKAELEGDIGDSHMGLVARLMGQACRKFTAKVTKSNCSLVFINQIREKLGVTFGSPETTPGGRALKFFASLRLDIRRIGQVKDGEKLIGNRVKVKGAKNKVGAPYRESEFDLLFESGPDTVGSLFDVAVAHGIIDKSGSWFSYKGDRLGQGRLNSIQAMKSIGTKELLSLVREKDKV